MQLDELTVMLAIVNAVKVDFNGMDIWELCSGMTLERITGYRVVFSLTSTEYGQYSRAYKYVNIGINNGQLIAQSQARHSITIDYHNPESMVELYKFIKEECFMKRPSRLREYRILSSPKVPKKAENANSSPK